MQPVPVDHRAAYDDDDDMEYDDLEDEEEPPRGWLGGSTAVKFLLAGGVAGAGKCSPSVLDKALTIVLQFHGHVQRHLTG